MTPVSVVSLWNQINPLKQKVPIKLTQSRGEKLRARLKENSDPSYWRRVFENIRDIPFYRGEGPRGWKATLDWVIKNDTNGVKIYEQEPDRHYHGAAYYDQFAEVFET
uniref:Uncharacterized protein n=1 Tax=Desulfobacca acetoxidans TaxID=60893 RepID=A0A7C3WQR8_9BACT